MLSQDIADSIWGHPSFRDAYAAVSSSYLAARLSIEPAALEEATVYKLAESAIALSNSVVYEHREAAYRLAIALTALYSAEIDGLGVVPEIVLSRLGNWPALISERLRLRLSSEATLGLPLLPHLEYLARRDKNTVKLQGSGTLTLTNFQLLLWSRLVSGASVSISAPTSAGKSFILAAFLLSQFRSDLRRTVVYIVPSRALISQVAALLNEEAARHPEMEATFRVYTAPIAAADGYAYHAALVMTPERLQLLLASDPTLAPDLLIVDEAQTVESGTRGVTLTAVIEQLLLRNPGTQLFFASPFSDNPQIFAELFDERISAETTDESPVAQNIVFLDFRGRRVMARTEIGGQSITLGSVALSAAVTTQPAILSEAVARFARGEQSLIFAKQPSDAEEYALAIARRLPGAGSAAREELAAFIRDTIHPEYCMAECALAGTGFHYGKMPSALRRAVELAFRVGDLNYLVTTSTLLHGVNLPARNIFVRRPYSGHGSPMQSSEFWNLAGRAGRLGQEFDGFVYVIDYEDWPSRPIGGDRKKKIQSAFKQTVLEQADRLLAYMARPDEPDGGGRNIFESTFAKLFNDYSAGRLERTLDRIGLREGDVLRRELTETVERSAQSIELSRETIAKTPSVSPYVQQRLYLYLQQRAAVLGPAALIPIHPMYGGSYERLKRVFNIINHIFRDAGDERVETLATIASQWMHGAPYPEIINGYFRARRKYDERYDIRKAIRDTLDKVDDKLRFQYVRYVQCYINILSQVISDRGHVDLLSSIPPLHVFLELGACQSTMMNLQALGLSRVASERVAALAPSLDLSMEETRKWLSQQSSVILINLPKYLRFEVEDITQEPGNA